MRVSICSASGIKLLLLGCALVLANATTVQAAQKIQKIVVALGASQTNGKGVERSEAYPAQLEALLHAAGKNVRVINAGTNGETTVGMLNGLSRSVPEGTSVVILQPGGNDRRHHLGGRATNIAAIVSALDARHIRTIMMENQEFKSLPRGVDDEHLTPQGYHMLAARFLPKVISALGR